MIVCTTDTRSGNRARGKRRGFSPGAAVRHSLSGNTFRNWRVCFIRLKDLQEMVSSDFCVFPVQWKTWLHDWSLQHTALCISTKGSESLIDDTGKLKPHTWYPTVETRIKVIEEKMAWQVESRKTNKQQYSHTEEKYSPLSLSFWQRAWSVNFEMIWVKEAFCLHCTPLGVS